MRTGPATADTRAAMPGSTTSRGSASRSVSTELVVGSVISSVKVGLLGRFVWVVVVCVGQGRALGGPTDLLGTTSHKLVQVIKKSGSGRSPLSIRDRMRTISQLNSGFLPLRQGLRASSRHDFEGSFRAQTRRSAGFEYVPWPNIFLSALMRHVLGSGCDQAASERDFRLPRSWRAIATSRRYNAKIGCCSASAPCMKLP